MTADELKRLRVASFKRNPAAAVRVKVRGRYLLRTPSDPHFGGLDSQVALEATAHGATDTITIPDAHLLFSGDFKRAGNDLILSDDKHKFVVHDYFKFDKHPTLLSPEGAALTADVVAALAGPLMPGHYAQATTPQGQAEAIGRVATVTGNATVIRNGVSIALNVGDAILKGDVVQTGADSALGVTFTDGTTFKLDASARMVINDYVYAENAANNSAAISLVQGSIQFLAGAVAHTGDMRVTTPVATMGIRGTAVNVQIDANDGTTHFSVMLEATGRTGSYNLYDNSTGALIGTVSNSGVGWVVSPAGPLQVVAQQFDKTAAQIQQELSVVQQVLSIQAIGQQIIQQAQQQDNTKSTDQHGTIDYFDQNNDNSRTDDHHDQGHDRHRPRTPASPATSSTTQSTVDKLTSSNQQHRSPPTNQAPIFYRRRRH